MTRRLVVLGAGGHAKVVLATAIAAGFEVVGVLDDDPAKWEQTVLGVPVTGPIRKVTSEEVSVVLGVGDNQSRERLAGLGLRWTSVIHPSALVHPSVEIGSGTVVFAGAVIQPDVVIGEHSIINTGATVDHDCVLGAFVHVAPGVHLSGGVKLGNGVFLGIGSAAIPGVTVGDWTVVGAGGIVVEDLPPGVTAVGVPAKTLYPRESGD